MPKLAGAAAINARGEAISHDGRFWQNGKWLAPVSEGNTPPTSTMHLHDLNDHGVMLATAGEDASGSGTGPQYGAEAGIILPLKLKLIWETANKANQIFNKTRKDDSTGNGLVIEKEGTATYCLPRNKLDLIANAPNNFSISVDLDLPSTFRHDFICAAYDNGAKIVGSDSRLPADGNVAAVMEITGTNAAVVKEFEIRSRYDANTNNLLDNLEAIPWFVYRKKDTNGAPVDEARYAIVKGVSRTKYQENHDAIQGQISGLSSIAVKTLVPNAHELLTRFLYGDFRDVSEAYLPSDSTGKGFFDAFQNATPMESCFSERLTHNSGAWFSEAGTAQISRLTWDGNSQFSDFLENVSPITPKPRLMVIPSFGGNPPTTVWQ